MKPECSFFEYDQKRTNCALGEPSLTLVRNGCEFGLLMAIDAHEDSYTGRLWLDTVTYLRVYGENFAYQTFPSVTIYKSEGLWLAQDADSDRYFPAPSERPYHVIFIDRQEFKALNQVAATGKAFPLFCAAQAHFGRLPGFSYSEKALRAPDDYANRLDRIDASSYIYPE